MKLIQSLLLFLLYTIPFMFLMWTISNPKYKRYYVLAKTVNSITFIAAAIYCAYYGANIEILDSLLPALLLCLVGDIILGFYNAVCDKTVKGNELSYVETNTNFTAKAAIFILGLLSFAFGHGCFIYAFSKMQRLTWIDFVFPVVAIFITIGLTKLDGMNTGRFTVLIAAYSFMVAMLFSKGIHILLSQFNALNLLLSAGATLFLISDGFILFLYFYEKKAKAIHIINLATYYYGMFFIALSMLY
nr:lysoplasmalogenase family protein [uncultured Anaerocolumna sp.]